MEENLSLSSEPIRPVNLEANFVDLVGQPTMPTSSFANDGTPYQTEFQKILAMGGSVDPNKIGTMKTEGIDTSGRFPLFYPGRDNEEMYAQTQSGWDKAYNGITKFAGTVGTTFINGTAGLVYGTGKALQEGQFSSLWNNDLTNSLNVWSKEQEDKYAHYKTLREREGSWWEPENLFTGNFLWDNIVKNLGFSAGAFAGGFAWSGALKAIGLTSKLVGTGTNMATRAEAVIAEGMALPQASSRISSITNGLTKLTGQALMKADRAIVATFATAGEAGLEALHNSIEFKEHLVDKFKKEHGYAPNKEEMGSIQEQAMSVGNWTYGLNTMLLTATNYIQLPKIFASSFGSEKAIANNIVREGSKYVSSLPQKGFGKFLYKSKNIASLFFNTAEGFEEGAQYAIQTGTQNYFGRKYGNKERSFVDDGLLHGVNEALFTDEGTLNIFTGAFSGAMQSSGFIGVKGGLPAFGKTGKIGDRGFAGYGGVQEKTRTEAITALNNTQIKSKLKEVYSNLKAAESIQEDRKFAVEQGDILESKDLELDFAHSFIDSRIKYGAESTIKDEIDTLKQEANTDGGFEQLKKEGYTAENDTKESFLTRLDNLQQHANHVIKLNTDLNIKYGGVVDSKTGKRIYSQEVIDQLVYASAKIFDYNKRLPQLNATLVSAGINTHDILNSFIKDDILNESAVVMAKQQIDELDGITEDEKEKLTTSLQDLIEISERKKMFLNEYNEIKKEPEKAKVITEETPAPIKAEETVASEFVEIKTKTGVKKLRTNIEYFLGKVTDLDKHGKEVYRMPRLTILGVNEDGTIKIKTSQGIVRDISPEEFEDYKLASVENTKKNKKANFFMEHWNVMYEHYGRKTKDGLPTTGRLVYDSENDILYFAYIKNGKYKQEEVINHDFIAKKGYKHAKIKEVGTLTAVQEDAKENFKKSEDSRKLTVGEKRLKILSELFDEVSINHNKTNNLISQKTKQVEKIKEELNKLRKEIQQAEFDNRSKAIKFKKAGKIALETAMKLSRMQTQLENELQILETEKEEIEATLYQILDFIDNVDNYSTDMKTFLEELNNDVIDLEIFRDKTGEQINEIVKLIKSTQRAINSAIELIGSMIQRFESKYPNVPRVMNQAWVDFTKANPNFLKLQPNYREELGVLEDYISAVEDEEITLNEKRIDGLNEHLNIAEEELVSLQKEIDAKTLILEKFEEVAKKYKQQKEEELLLNTNEELVNQIVGTLDNDIENIIDDGKEYEADSKKSDLDVVTSTIVPAEKVWNPTKKIYENTELRDHHKRSNRFGFRFNTLENADLLGGVIVNVNTENDIIPGLINHLIGGKEISPNDVLVLVVTDQNGKPVNEFGETIEEGVDLINNAIYQVFPTSKLTTSYGSMFRESISESVKEDLKEQYKAWRESELNSKELSNPKTISASFGHIENVIYKDEDGYDQKDHSARTTVQETGLISNDDLLSGPVVTVAASSESISNGSVTFNTPLGRVFLEVPNGLVKLFNRKFSRKEATTIFEAIHYISKKTVEKDGMDLPETKGVIRWLQSVVYWGISKDKEGQRKSAGYNSIWFENVLEEGKRVNKLFISGKGGSFSFSPLALEENREAIIGVIENLYGNTKKKLLHPSSYNAEYYQIIGFSNNEPQIITWPNYQSYLLSDKSPDSKGGLTDNRNKEEIPLTTNIRPLQKGNPDDTNRKSIYFSIVENVDNFIIKAPIKVAQTPKQPKQPTAQSPSIKPRVVTQNPPKGIFILDGNTTNTKMFSTLGEIKFKVFGQQIIDLLSKKDSDTLTDAKKFADFVSEVIKKKLFIIEQPSPEIVNGAVNNQIATSEEDALNKIILSTFAAIRPQLVSQKITKETTPEVIPTPVVKQETPSTGLTFFTTSEETSEEEFMGASGADIDSSFDALTNFKHNDTAYRKKLEEEEQNFKSEKWEELEAWFKEFFPNLPIYRVKNIIQATNGEQAWGMLQNGAIYIYENAQIGTAYHEVFEAVWKMFTDPKEQKLIIDEFRKRQGSYKDRFTGEIIEYKNATDAQLKEELAEEFRDFRLFGKKPITQGKSLIGRLFSDIIQFIKEFFMGENALSNTQKLFDKIGRGYYAKYMPYESQLSFAKVGFIDIDNIEAGSQAEFRARILSSVEESELSQHMIFTTLSGLVKNNKSLFNIAKENKKDLEKRLRDEILGNIEKQIPGIIIHKYNQYVILNEEKKLSNEDLILKHKEAKILYTKVIKDWNNLFASLEDKLRAYSITFDENDELNLGDENNSGKGDYQDATKIDGFRKANSAIKLLFATLPDLKVGEGSLTWKPSSVGGVTLMAADKVFINLISKLNGSRNIDEMLTTLKALGKTNINYATLYERLTKTNIKNDVDYSTFEEHDFQLLMSFWKSMKRQNADVLSVFIFGDNEVVINNSAISSASQQAKREITNNLINTIREDKTKYFSYDKKEGTYSSTEVIKNKKLDSNNLLTYTNFLKDLGINLTKEGGIPFSANEIKIKLNSQQLKLFKEAVEYLLQDLSEVKDVKGLSGNTLNINNRLLELGIISAILSNPEFESTYFNINGERTQTYIGTNTLSSLYDSISQSKNIKDLENTDHRFLLTDKFSAGSLMLEKLFNIKGDGKRKVNTDHLLGPVYIDGTINQAENKKKQSAKLNFSERIIQEINLNLQGVFLNLIPGDASLEWAVKMFDKQDPFISKDGSLNKNYINIFKNYLISEINLARDNRPVVFGRNNNHLRFFKDILADHSKESKREINSLHDKIVSSSKKLSAETIYENNKVEIEKAIERFVAQSTEDTITLLEDNHLIVYGEEDISVKNVDFKETIKTKEDLDLTLKTLSLNYIMANIELHKILYSDPYQYTDELKRIKNFLSPRQQLLHGSGKINSALHKLYNKGFEKGSIGYSDMNRDYFRSIVLSDILSVDDILDGYSDPYEETDGQGYISLRAYRIFKLRAGEWTEDNEKQYRHDIRYEELIKSGATQEVINKHEKSNPFIKDTYTPIKPIVAGSQKNGRDYNDIVLDKFALVPLSFRVLHIINPDSNILKLYNKMQREDIDYAVYNTGRKVGAENVVEVYDSEGNFNDAPLETKETITARKKLKIDINQPITISNIPFSIIGVQTEVPSKSQALVTRGTQITKLATLDFMEAGVPIDFIIKDLLGNEITDLGERYSKWMGLTISEKEKRSPLYNEIQNNKTLLEEMIQQGFLTLLDKLGINQKLENINGKLVSTFFIENKDKLIKTLKEEVLKRSVNDNIIATFNELKSGDVLLEASPSYQQIRNILYSIADKNVVKPKISGGMKVQVSSALLESNKIKGIQYKDKNGNIKIKYTSDVLKFYRDKDGERTCEIMVGRWFKSNLSDQELLDYLNLTPEGQKILSGIAFRIPTQKQNSIDRFVIKQFLPEEFGDSVVIPSALVKKSGSDFDIDKLSIYFKNVFKNINGKIEAVPFYGYGTEAIDKFEKLFYSLHGEKLKQTNAKIFSNSRLGTLVSDIISGESTEKETDKWVPIFTSMFERFADENEKVEMEDVKNYFKRKAEALGKKLDELTDYDLQEILAYDFKQEMYKKSLENKYIESLENLVSHELNFKNLIKPNSAKIMKNLTKEINKSLGKKEIDYTIVGNMLNRGFMSNLRHAFVTGKYAIGIAAVNQTNHAQNQRDLIYIDLNMLDKNNIEEEDKIWLKDGKINFKNYNSVEINGKITATLSGITNKAGEYISDTIGMFIDGYVDISKGPWIMELGATPNVASTWLFLVKIGVPIRDVAFFMNQPIIKEYLSLVEGAGYSWLFIDDLVEVAKSMYKSEEKISEISLTEELLKPMLGQSIDKLSQIQLAQQGLILDEFLKYSKMANHLFLVTQGSNFDTASFSDPFLIFKKLIQLKRAQNTIISSVDKTIESSFLSILQDSLLNIRDAFSTVLLSDKYKPGDTTKLSIRELMETILAPYVDLNDRTFIKVSQKAVSDLFDWAVQIDRGINQSITSTLVGTDTDKSAVRKVIDFKNEIIGDASSNISGQPNHPLYNNIILNSLKLVRESEGNKADSLYIAGRDNKIFDTNIIINSFREIRDAGGVNKDLYSKLVRIAILQSGLTPSPISFSQLLPYEDFKEIYQSSLEKLENMPNLADFYNLHMFERNSWSNTDIVSARRAKLKIGEHGLYNPDIAFLSKKLKAAIKNKTLPQLFALPSRGRFATDFITYTYEPKPISKHNRKILNKKGDRSYIKKILLQKVYAFNEAGERVPLQQIDKKNGVTYIKNIYKPINALGDSYRAKEFYLYKTEYKDGKVIGQSGRPSVMDNGYMKIETTYDKKGSILTVGEIEDDGIITAILNSGRVETENNNVSPPIAEIKSTNKLKEENIEDISWEEIDNNDTCNPF